MADPAVWPFAPGGEYSEELAWLTDMLQAPSGGTQHRRLRQSPRTVIAFAALESGAVRRRMELLLRANSALPWWVPVAIDVRSLGSAVSIGATSLPVTVDNARFIGGGKVLAMGNDSAQYELLSIASGGVSGSALTLSAATTKAWPAGTLLYPVRRGNLAEAPQIGRFTGDSVGLVELRFMLDDPLDTTAALSGSTYRGLPVFDAFAPAWSSDPTWTPERLAVRIDDEIATPFVADLAGVSTSKMVMRYAPDTAAAVVSFRAALFALAGRWSPVWVPTAAHDLRMVAAVSNGQGYIDVEGPLLSTLPLPANRRDIRIELEGGTVHHRRITAAAAQSATVDRLTLDSTITTGFALEAVRRVCFLSLCVQDSDTNRLDYFGPAMLQCELSWRELDHEL